MDLRKHHGALVAASILLLSSSTWAEKTLWLIRPLYPGQETLVERTQKALDRLMPGAARQEAVIGQGELAAALKGVPGELPCFSAEVRCADPIDPFVASLGFERIVLIQGGQDEAGYKFKVVAYEPKSGRVNPASATNASLEKALLGAVAKVVPAASTLEVNSTPPGATVFIDDVKVGITPLETQVLPGERSVRLDLKLHQPLEESVVIPIRGKASLEKTLEKVAARIVITAMPPGTEISIDGVLLGRDKVDRGIIPGDHTIRLNAENYRAFEQVISVKADQQYSLDKTLDPIMPGAPFTPSTPGDVTVVVRPDPPPPPKPATTEELIYGRTSYFQASFEAGSLAGNTLVGLRFDKTGRTTSLLTPGRALIGASLEYGTFGKYFGLTVFGVSYLTNVDPWSLNVGWEPKKSCETSGGVCGPTQMDNVRAHLFVARMLHPQFRLVFWRMQLSLQVGLDFRLGQVTGQDPGASSIFYNEGFVPLDIMVAGRLNARFYIVDGVFAHLQGNYTHYLWGVRGTDASGTEYGSSGAFGVNGGFGYAF